MNGPHRLQATEPPLVGGSAVPPRSGRVRSHPRRQAEPDRIENGLVNVSRGGLATQSSLSAHSSPGEAADALDGAPGRPYAFQTAVENSPWWMVDLGSVYPLHLVVIENRRDGHHFRASSLLVEVSADARDWRCVHAGFLVWSGELRLPLRGEMMARHVRLRLAGRGRLHLAKVEVYTRRPPVSVRACRGDGFGCRTTALVHAIWISRVLNCDFSLSWPSAVNGPAGRFAAVKEVLDGRVLGHSVEPAAAVFSQDFLTGRVVATRPRESRINFENGLTAADLLRPAFHNEPGVIYAPLRGVRQVLGPHLAPGPGFGLADAFEAIGFSDRMREALDAAAVAPVPDGCAVLHVRSGDIVFGAYRMQGRRFLNRGVSVSLARFAIETLRSEGRQVILFGDDLDTLRLLARDTGARIGAEMLPPAGRAWSAGQRALFEIALMSRAGTIVAGVSGFASLARDIGRTVTLRSVYRAGTPETMAGYIADDLAKNGHLYHPLQEAFARWHLYDLTRDRRSLAEKEAELELCSRADPENPMYLLVRAAERALAGQADRAEQAVGDLLRAGESNMGAIVARHLDAPVLAPFIDPLRPLAAAGGTNAARLLSLVDSAGPEANRS